MSDIETITRDLHNIFCRYKEKKHKILIDAFNGIDTCDGDHLARTQEVHGKIIWSRPVIYFYHTILAVLIILLTCGMWFLRRFNHASIFGGCSIFFLWSFDECPVAY